MKLLSAILFMSSSVLAMNEDTPKTEVTETENNQTVDRFKKAYKPELWIGKRKIIGNGRLRGSELVNNKRGDDMNKGVNRRTVT